MKCRYQFPHEPQKCGLLNSSWNDPVAMMERAVEMDSFTELARMFATMERGTYLPYWAYYSDDMVGIAVEFWKNYDITVCDHHGNEWKRGEKIKEGDHD